MKTNHHELQLVYCSYACHMHVEHTHGSATCPMQLVQAAAWSLSSKCNPNLLFQASMLSSFQASKPICRVTQQHVWLNKHMFSIIQHWFVMDRSKLQQWMGYMSSSQRWQWLHSQSDTQTWHIGECEEKGGKCNSIITIEPFNLVLRKQIKCNQSKHCTHQYSIPSNTLI